jgi:hypothetical protein
VQFKAIVTSGNHTKETVVDCHEDVLIVKKEVVTDLPLLIAENEIEDTLETSMHFGAKKHS